MESKRGALIVLGLVLVVSVVLLVVCAKHGGQRDSDFSATLESWKSGLLAKLAKSQELATSDLSPNPFDAKGDCRLAPSAPIHCNVAKSSRSVRKATLELAGPGSVVVNLVARRKGGDLDCKKTLHRSSAGGLPDDKATIDLTAFDLDGTLTIAPAPGQTTPVLLHWKVE